MRKMNVKCFVREELIHNDEIREEVAALRVRADQGFNATAVRFTFFRQMPTANSWKNLDEEAVLGYVVLLRLNPPLKFRDAGRLMRKHGYILEAVIRPPTVFLEPIGGSPTFPSGGQPETVTNYYVHCCKEFSTTIGTSKNHRHFKIFGTFFTQQNQFTHACAHAALRIAINSWPQYRGRKLTYERINRILKADHAKLRGKLNEGLEAKTIAKVIRALGYEPAVAEFVNKPQINYEDYLYPFVESSCPIILGIANPETEHVVTVLGHTFNSDRWTEARHNYGTLPWSHYISASAWADHFIVNDDNYGMYVTLPSEALKNIIVPKYNPNLHASVAIAVFPQRSSKRRRKPQEEVHPFTAEQWAGRAIKHLLSNAKPKASNRWLRLLKTEHVPVFRTLIRDKKSYLEYLAAIHDDQGHSLNEREKKMIAQRLPDSFWVTEVTTPDLYTGNKKKVGEIVSKTVAAGGERQEILLFAWLAGFVWLGSNLIGAFPWSIRGHVPLIRGIPKEKCKLEW